MRKDFLIALAATIAGYYLVKSLKPSTQAPNGTPNTSEAPPLVPPPDAGISSGDTGEISSSIGFGAGGGGGI